MLVLRSVNFNWLHNYHLFFQQTCISVRMHNSQTHKMPITHSLAINLPTDFPLVSPADAFTVKDLKLKACGLGEAGISVSRFGRKVGTEHGASLLLWLYSCSHQDWRLYYKGGNMGQLLFTCAVSHGNRQGTKWAMKEDFRFLIGELPSVYRGF